MKQLNKDYFYKGNCPYCNSENIKNKDNEYDTRTVYREYQCRDCKQRWTEVHEVTRVMNPDTDDSNYFDVTTHDYGRKE